MLYFNLKMAQLITLCPAWHSMCCCCVSVGPLICPLAEATASHAAPVPVVDQEYTVDLKKAAILGEPIVGIKAVTMDRRRQGAMTATILPSPKEPTQAEIDRHIVLHLPLESWCPICVACRGPTDHRRRVADLDRSLPLLVGGRLHSQLGR